MPRSSVQKRRARARSSAGNSIRDSRCPLHPPLHGTKGTAPTPPPSRAAARRAGVRGLAKHGRGSPRASLRYSDIPANSGAFRAEPHNHRGFALAWARQTGAAGGTGVLDLSATTSPLQQKETTCPRKTRPFPTVLRRMERARPGRIRRDLRSRCRRPRPAESLP